MNSNNFSNFNNDKSQKTTDQLLKVLKNSNDYGYQIFDGSKTPSRDKVIALALPMQLTLDEANRLLHLSNNGILYPKIKRDSIIIFGLENNQKIINLNITLDDFGEAPLG